MLKRLLNNSRREKYPKLLMKKLQQRLQTQPSLIVTVLYSLRKSRIVMRLPNKREVTTTPAVTSSTITKPKFSLSSLMESPKVIVADNKGTHGNYIKMERSNVTIIPPNCSKGQQMGKDGVCREVWYD